jgi:two-component system sensor histidine kinase CpxA
MGPSLTRRRDEIGQLAAEFNQMAEQIRDQLASKEMLLRDISHELRSPLTRLRVAAGLARAKEAKSISTSNGSSGTLNGLIA